MVLFLYTTEIFRFWRKRCLELIEVFHHPLSIMKSIFEPRPEHPYNLRCISQSSTTLISKVFHYTESIYFLEPKIWSLLPENFKNIDSFENFTIPIKKWKLENYPCRLCKVYIKNVGFL